VLHFCGIIYTHINHYVRIGTGNNNSKFYVRGSYVCKSTWWSAITNFHSYNKFLHTVSIVVLFAYPLCWVLEQISTHILFET
jgi:hypothetical protein